MRCDKSIDDVSRSTDTRAEPFHPPCCRLQDGRGNTEEDHEAERAARGLAVSAREERQGGDCGVEVGPQRDPQCLQRAFSALLAGRRSLSPVQTELAMNTHTIVADMHQNVLKIHKDVNNQNQGVSGLRAI